MRIAYSLLIGMLAVPIGLLQAAPLDRSAVDEFITYMVTTHAFERDDLNRLFGRTERSERIIELMTRPAEKEKPWWQYRTIFISEKRISDGVDFWNDNIVALNRASTMFGVAPEVIVAIIGVETAYGRIVGIHRVMDALSTLAFHYPGDKPRRARFFRDQLEHYLLFTREDKLDPLLLKGSYAGAMGVPQFMPENYRKLAVDFDGDGTRDIWSNVEDAIGSVANYLNHYGWQQSGPVTSRADIGDADPGGFLNSSIKPEFDLSELVAAGIKPIVQNAAFDEKSALFELEGREGNEYWLGFTNFYVISRYNPRVKYALAVAQLSEAIRKSRSESGN
jgi:membrane-bound lytic murein transglycosylase B